jgi:hypothetical protein
VADTDNTLSSDIQNYNNPQVDHNGFFTSSIRKSRVELWRRLVIASQIIKTILFGQYLWVNLEVVLIMR